MILTGTIYLELCWLCWKREAIQDTASNRDSHIKFVCSTCYRLPTDEFLKLRDNAILRDKELKYKKD